MDPTTITRAGNVLEIRPDHEGVLGPALTYQHRELQSGMDEVHFGRVKIVTKMLYRVENEALLTTQGAAVRVQNALTSAGVSWVYVDKRTKQTLVPNYEHLKLCLPNLQFRYRQKEVLAHLIGHNSGQFVAPTAYGKTFLMMALVALYPDANIIIASPSVSLLASGYRRVREVAVDVGRVGGGHRDVQRVTLTTIQSLLQTEVAKCDILLVDESHRIASSKASQQIAVVRNAVKIFGMTATPVGRTDGAELVAEVLLGPVVYDISYAEAADAGVVSPLKVLMLELNTDQFSWVISQDYQTRIARKRHAYWRNKVRNKKLTLAAKEAPKRLGFPDDCQTLILTETVEHAFRLKLLLPEYEVVYASLSKTKRQKFVEMGLISSEYKALTPKQKEMMLRDFETGNLRKVIATGTWGEGVDFTHLDVLINAAGGSADIGVIQWSGRNSRIHDGKVYGLIIDCRDQWDPWAEGRAAKRLAIYRKKGWEIMSERELEAAL